MHFDEQAVLEDVYTFDKILQVRVGGNHDALVCILQVMALRRFLAHYTPVQVVEGRKEIQQGIVCQKRTPGRVHKAYDAAKVLWQRCED